MFSKESSSFVFIESFSWTGIVQFYVQALHIIQLVWELLFGSPFYFREDFHVVPIDGGVAVFFMRRETRF